LDWGRRIGLAGVDATDRVAGLVAAGSEIFGADTWRAAVLGIGVRSGSDRLTG